MLRRPIETTALIKTLIERLLDSSLSVVGQFDFPILSNSATPATRDSPSCLVTGPSLKT